MIRSRRVVAPLRGALGRTMLLLTGAQSVVLVVTVAVLFWANDRMRQTVDAASEAFVEEQWMSDRVVSGVMQQLVAASAYQHATGPWLQQAYREAGARVHEELRRYLARDLSSEQRRQIERVKLWHERFEVSAIQSLERLEAGDFDGASAASREMAAHALELENATEAFLALRHDELHELQAGQKEAFRGLYAVAGLLGVLVLATALGTAYFLYFRVATPLGELADAARRFGGGDLSARVRIPAEAELAAAATSFNRMADALATIRSHLERRNEELEQTLVELRRAQAALVQTEKMSAMGRMVAGLAHELNNPLASILGYAELLDARLQEGDLTAGEIRDDFIDGLLGEASRARELARNLLRFGRESEVRLGSVSLNESLDVATGIQGFAFEKAGLHLEVDAPGPLFVRAESQRLQQALLNVVSNAYDAMKGRGDGTLRIRARACGDRVVVTLDDEGPGFSDPTRAFEPFYTTKAVGEGTGLGLSLVHRFMDEFGGAATAENRPEGGARVTLVFRSAPVVAPAETPAPVSEPRGPAPLRILLVEDEAPMRGLQARMLGRLGADVLLAASGEEARALLRASAVHMVVSDVRMPNGSGLDLYRWIQKERPQLAERFLFVTGDVADPEVAALATEQPELFLRKPFQMAEYLERVSARAPDPQMLLSRSSIAF